MASLGGQQSARKRNWNFATASETSIHACQTFTLSFASALSESCRPQGGGEPARMASRPHASLNAGSSALNHQRGLPLVPRCPHRSWQSRVTLSAPQNELDSSSNASDSIANHIGGELRWPCSRRGGHFVGPCLMGPSGPSVNHPNNVQFHYRDHGSDNHLHPPLHRRWEGWGGEGRTLEVQAVDATIFNPPCMPIIVLPSTEEQTIGTAAHHVQITHPPTRPSPGGCTHTTLHDQP